jgi:hypothetical protein
MIDPARRGDLKKCQDNGCESNWDGQEWQQSPQAGRRLGALFGGWDRIRAVGRRFQP